MTAEDEAVPLPDIGPYRRRWRHAIKRGEAHGPGWIAVLLALGVLGATLLALVSLPPRQHGAVAVPGASAGGGPPLLPVSGTTAPSPSLTGQSVSPAPGSARPSRTRARTPSPRPKPFAPVTYEAEAPGNTLSGSAWVDSYPGASGGRIVRNLGRWAGTRVPGSLRFNGVTVPVAGTYTLTFFYVHLDNEQRRDVDITVAGSAPVQLAVDGSSTCCASRSLRVRLAAGGNAITFTNPDDHAPSIDKIVISAG
jgi:hypothetical protein